MQCTHPKRSEVVAWRVIEGEAIVVEPRSGRIFPFNAVATRFWELMDGNHDRHTIVAQVVTEFDVETNQIESDLEFFINECQTNQLLTQENS